MFSRNFTIIINWILDNIIPPILKDQRWFMYPIIYIVYGKYTKYIMNFKEAYPNLSESEINEYYEKIKDAPINSKRLTDLNSASIEYILNNISGDSVLDASCGRGFLAKKIADKGFKVTDSDIVVQSRYSENDNLKFQSANITNLPFNDKSFDTVICTHTLEHIKDYKLAIDELCRVCRKKLIIIIPCQREYKYTSDLHVNFCPYLFSFKNFIGIFKLKGDFVCVVNFN